MRETWFMMKWWLFSLLKYDSNTTRWTIQKFRNATVKVELYLCFWKVTSRQDSGTAFKVWRTRWSGILIKRAFMEGLYTCQCKSTFPIIQSHFQEWPGKVAAVFTISKRLQTSAAFLPSYTFLRIIFFICSVYKTYTCFTRTEIFQL